jgi:poly(3-hydroxybutyrate) depolymerase
VKKMQISGSAAMRRRVAKLTTAIATLAMAACSHGADEAAGLERLPKLPIDPGSVTVSGISSGGNMATQFHVAHSGLVQGAAVLAAAPYGCAEGSVRLALGRCMRGEPEIPVARLVGQTRELARDGRIDAVAGLDADRVWLFHGSADPYVDTRVADALEAYYRDFVPAANLARVELAGASHTFPTARPDAAPCNASEAPFLGACGLDGARTLLAHLYGELAPGRAARDAGLVRFDQRGYAAAAGSAGLAEGGWLYVPEGCAAAAGGACRLHVVFHGCQQGGSFVGDAFVRGAGYLEVAEANRIVLLFPQVEKSLQPLNAFGCWDWWGYEGAEYATRDGGQVRAVRAMIADLLGEAPPAR